MSGKMTIEVPTARKILLINLVSCLLTGAVIFAAVRFLTLKGLLGGAVLAVTAYILFHVFYSLATNAMAASMTKEVKWEMSADFLLLAGMYPESRKADIFTYDEIEKVYIWKNRTAIGQGLPGLTVNITIPHDNLYFRSLRHGTLEQVSQSEEEVRAFLIELSRHTKQVDTALL